ncbi:MAG: butyrate kinase [Lachnospiraceae bacterium]|nr:butyrate kinase [Lachnospiraceae bacterium]
MEKLLIINPGSTSTKIAVYEDEKALFVESISHSSEELAPFENVVDQYAFREKLILETMEKHGVMVDDLTCIVSRGGVLPTVHSGAYRVNEDMVWQLTYAPLNEHASNLGAIIAHAIATRQGIPAYIYDAVGVDEMIPLTQITGFPEVKRHGLGHNLNTRAAAIRYAKEAGKNYNESTIIVAHLGGGISVNIHHNGRIIDMINDEGSTFSPERAGFMPNLQLVKLATSGEYDRKSLTKRIKSKGGLMAYFGVNDSRKVEAMIAEGDEKAKLVYEAMALNTAKNIAEVSVVVNGKVDAIVLTGGIAYSKMFTQMISDRVSFIAPVTILPGENEMECLALGGLRVQRGEETAREYVKVEID